MANETKLNMTLLLRRADFDDSCVLKEGEPGYHTVDKVFKVGDGTTPWGTLPIANASQIQAMIDATASEDFKNYYTKTEVDNIRTALEGAINGVDGELAAEVTARTQADTQIRTDFAAADATTLANAKSYADTKKTEVIGTSADAKTADTVYGAKAFATDAATTAKSEAINAAAADATSKANAAESAAKSHAETKATAAENAAMSYADTQDTALHTTITGEISAVKTELEGKISSGDSATLTNANNYTDEQVAAEAKLRSDADAALDDRIEKLEAFFEGADHDGESGGLKDALDTLVEIQTYIETEGAAADEMVKDIAQNASDIDALESRMGTAEGTITSLGTNKLDKSVYETYINGKAMSDEALKSYADGKASAAETAAKNHANQIKTDLQAEIDADVEALATGAVKANTDAIAAINDSTNGILATAKAYADTQDTALATALKGTKANGDTTAETIRGAKDYADKVAAAAQAAAEATASADATAKANAAQSAAEATAAADATSKANTAKADAIATVVGTADDAAEADTIKGVRKAFAAADTATLTSAQAYTDAQLKAAAAKVKAGTENDDIIVTLNTSTGETTVAHKTYATGTYTKAPESSDKTGDIYFFDSIATTNGHVTGGTMKSLASILEGMTFIFDGGTSKTTVE